MTLASRIKKILDRKIEDKVIVRQITLANHNSSIGTGDCYPLVPAVPQGTDNWQRVGDKIKPKYLLVTGYFGLVFDPVNHTPAQGGGQSGVLLSQSPLRVRMIAFTQNDIKAASSGSAVDVTALLRGDAGTTVAYTGLASDNLRPVNKDKFKVIKDMQAELVPIPGSTQDGVYRTNVHFSFKVKCPATFKYDANSGDLPNNFAPFIALGYAYPNQATPDVTTTPVVFNVMSRLVYEDA